MLPKYVAYARVSTANQKEEGTVEIQETALQEYADANGIELVFPIFKDEGVSGALEDRPALAELFAYLEGKQGAAVEGVLIFKLDRLARDLYIQEHLIQKFEKLGKRLVSTKEPDLDSKDPMRKAFRQFSGIVSELEKGFITMRLSAGRINKARKGLYAGGGLALGYKSEEGDLVVDDAHAETVKDIFRMKRNRRMSLRQIAKQLNDEGRPTARGGKWYASTVRYVLGNQLYRGHYSYKAMKSERLDLRLLQASGRA